MYNRVILMGRLTADPELKQTQSGIARCRVSIAVDRGYAKQGEEKKTDFFDITFWRQQAEFVCRYFSKGRMIHVEGKLQNNNYTDQNGVKHYRNSIIADNVSFCGDKGNNQPQQNGGYYQPNQPYQQPYQPQQQNYTPNPQTPYSGAQASQNGYYQQPQYQQAGQPPQYQQRPPQQQQAQLGVLSQYEEILADGETPF